MSYLSDITVAIRNHTLFSLHNSVYMGNDINAIDTAYSDTQNHKVSIFLVPAEKTSGMDTGRLVDTNYFNAYIFIPVEDDVSATDAWELGVSTANDFTTWLATIYTSSTASSIRPVNGREFRVGRGYYIYVQTYTVDTIITYVTDGYNVRYFQYTGETDGVATYNTIDLQFCSINEKYALYRSVNGIYKNYGCEVVVPALGFNPQSPITHSFKDWFVIKAKPDVSSKAEAMANGYKVYEVNEWTDEYGDSNSKPFLGMILVGA